MQFIYTYIDIMHHENRITIRKSYDPAGNLQ